MLDVSPLLLAFETVVFLSLIYLLNKLLYLPMLSFMDKRDGLLLQEDGELMANAKSCDDLRASADAALAAANAEAMRIRNEAFSAAKAESEKLISQTKEKLKNGFESYSHAMAEEESALRAYLVTCHATFEDAIQKNLKAAL
ncbi:MAG: hypothetical protein RL154_1187 [Pseudomonadota bacterium]